MNNKGFTLIEVLVATSIIFMLLTTILPISLLLEKERIVLSERRMLAAHLHDELQQYLWNDLDLPKYYSTIVNQIEVSYNFAIEERLIKGCVTWENARKTDETICFYGYK